MAPEFVAACVRASMPVYLLPESVSARQLEAALTSEPVEASAPKPVSEAEAIRRAVDHFTGATGTRAGWSCAGAGSRDRTAPISTWCARSSPVRRPHRPRRPPPSRHRACRRPRPAARSSTRSARPVSPFPRTPGRGTGASGRGGRRPAGSGSELPRIECHGCGDSYIAFEMDRDPSNGHRAICLACVANSSGGDSAVNRRSSTRTIRMTGFFLASGVIAPICPHTAKICPDPNRPRRGSRCLT